MLLSVLMVKLSCLQEVDQLPMTQGEVPTIATESQAHDQDVSMHGNESVLL